MQPANRILFTAVALGIAASAFAAPPKESPVQIHESKTEFVLSRPNYALTLIIPKSGLVEDRSNRARASETPGYFAFADPKAGILVSGWIEPQAKFTSAKEIWEMDSRGWIRKGLPRPLNVAFRKIDGWTL